MDVSNYILPKNSNSVKTDSMKRKGATSLESINAVERELDEVLKDLEMNSQDLNLSFKDLQQKTLNSSQTELAIRFGNPQSKFSYLASPNFPSTNSEFLTNANVKQNSSNRISTTSSSSTSTIQNTTASENELQKKRKNVLSTYEFCEECFDPKSESTTNQTDSQTHHQHSSTPLKITLHSTTYTDSNNSTNISNKAQIHGVALPIRTPTSNKNQGVSE